jgi:hypothetical protein
MNLSKFNLSALRTMLANDKSLTEKERKQIQVEICYRQFGM